MEELKLFSIVPDSTKEEVLNPSSNLVGQAFRGIAHMVLDPLVKYNIVKDAEMNDFAEKIKRKNDKIPLESRDDSRLGLTYKAVEDASYQLNSEKLREMFANLISATVDKRKNDSIRPSFSSTLKDMSPDDASLFETLYKEPSSVPIVSIRVQNKKTSQGLEIVSNLILLEGRIIQKQVSIDTLERFGLIDVKPGSSLAAKIYEERYNKFNMSPIFKKIESDLPRDHQGVLLDEAKLIKGNVKLTSLGNEFGKVVIF